MIDIPDDVRHVQELGRAAVKVLSHPKFLALSPAAAWLWMRGLTYLTAGNGTLGGMITDKAFKQIGGTRARADELIRAGLWRRDQQGWRMRRLNAPVRPSMPQTPPQAKAVGTEVMRFPAIGESGVWILTREQIDAWQETFTSVDVKAECGYAKAWLEADVASRKKTARGMPTFLVRWLSRAVDSRRSRPDQKRGGMGAGLTGPAPPGKYDHLSRSDETE